MLAFGQMEQGGQYWCYVAIKPSRYDAFKQAMDSKQYNMQRFAGDGYGEVIVSGEGVTPPQDITRQVANMFGIPIGQLFTVTDPKGAVSQQLKTLETGGNPA
jgi:hypothetical protein